MVGDCFHQHHSRLPRCACEASYPVNERRDQDHVVDGGRLDSGEEPELAMRQVVAQKRYSQKD